MCLGAPSLFSPQYAVFANGAVKQITESQVHKERYQTLITKKSPRFPPIYIYMKAKQ